MRTSLLALTLPLLLAAPFASAGERGVLDPKLQKQIDLAIKKGVWMSIGTVRGEWQAARAWLAGCLDTLG